MTTADLDGVFPDGFYSTTNLPTKVRLDGRWYDVANPEMDCGLVVETDGDGPRPRRHAPDVRRQGGDERRHRRLRHPGAGPAGRQGRRGVRLHGVRRLLGEATGRAGAPGRRRHAGGPGGRQEAAVGGRPRRRTHRGGAGDGGDGPRGLRRRAVRRQRAGHPRHRGRALRHEPGGGPLDGPRRRARPRAPHPGPEHDPQGGVDPGGGGRAACSGRDHARPGHPRQEVRPGRVGPRRRAAAGRLHRRDRGPAGDAGRDSPTSVSA